jgi:hypothetical protein
MWSADRLHLSPAGHRRVAAHVLTALGVGVDEEWLLVPPMPAPTPWLLARRADLRWAGRHLAPWLKRRLAGTRPAIWSPPSGRSSVPSICRRPASVTPMPVANDPAPALQAYAHPEKLVTTEWLAANLETPGLVIVESDEDVLLYETGHIPGAVKVDWHLELNDQVTRDYLDPAAFAALCEPRASAGTTRSCSTATTSTGGRIRAVGVQPLRATATCACWTAAGRSGRPRAAS